MHTLTQQKRQEHLNRLGAMLLPPSQRDKATLNDMLAALSEAVDQLEACFRCMAVLQEVPFPVGAVFCTLHEEILNVCEA